MHPKTLDELIAQSIQDKSVETIDPELLKTLFVDYKDLIKYVTQTPIMGEGIARFVIASVIRSLGSKHLYQLVNDLPNFAAVIENLDQFNQNIFFEVLGKDNLKKLVSIKEQVNLILDLVSKNPLGGSTFALYFDTESLKCFMDLELFKKCVLSFRVIDYNTDMSYFQKVDVFLKKLGTQCIQQLIPSYKQLQELSGEKPGLCGSLLVDNLDQAYLKKLITSTEKSSTPAPYLFFTPEGIIERNRKYHDSHLDPEAEKKFGLNAM